MKKMFKVGVAGLLVVSVAGCAAEVGTAIGMQIQKSRARGEPIDLYRDKFGRQYEQTTTLNGQPAYVWDLSYDEVLTVETGSYAYHNTDRPGMTTGITYEDRLFSRQCILTMA